jgi:predicted CxxxxCH...CXXCH cytochrome family protein
VFVASTPTTTILPADAVQIGKITAWNGNSIAIPLTGGTTTDRRVTNGSSKYLYTVYDMASGTTGTTRANVTAVGVNSPDTGVTGLGYLSNVITLTTGVKATIVNCTDCHGDATTGFNNMDSPTRSAATGSFVGSHNKHVGSYTISCTACHPDNTGNTGHRTGSISLLTTISPSGMPASGAYSKGTVSGALKSFPQSSIASIATMGTCNNVYCHTNGAGTATATPTWGNSATGACGTCHGVTASAPPSSARHWQHVSTLGGYKFTCSNCHYNVVDIKSDSTVTSAITSTTLHVNNAYNVNYDPAINPNANAYGTGGAQNCSNLYCHSQGNATITTPASRPVVTANWGITLDCAGCHT